MINDRYRLREDIFVVIIYRNYGFQIFASTLALFGGFNCAISQNLKQVYLLCNTVAFCCKAELDCVANLSIVCPCYLVWFTAYSFWFVPVLLRYLTVFWFGIGVAYCDFLVS